MKNVKKIVAGAIVVAVVVGGSITATAGYTKEKAKENVSAQKTIESENKVVTGGNEQTDTGSAKSIEAENITSVKGNVDKENTKNQDIKKSSEKNNDKTNNGIYKAGVTAAQIEEVRSKSTNQLHDFASQFGSHFMKTGDLIFSGEEGDKGRIDELYNGSEKALNSVWGELKTVLSSEQMQKLTVEQNQWIKQKDSIKKESTSILSAETNTKYAKGQETYKRCVYLINTYLGNY